MKRLNLDETWNWCIRLWRSVARRKRAGDKRSVEALKEEWIEKHWQGESPDYDCFFCEYDLCYKYKGERCGKCPARLVDRQFNCEDEDYDYKYYPIAFYNKLVSLNRKRLRKKAK